MFLRSASVFLKKYLEDGTITSGKVLLVSGARQVGKTTLVTSFAEELKQSRKVISINLETDRLFLHRLDQVRSFADFIELMILDFDFDDSQPQLLVIDEAQESTQLGSFVRQLKEDLKKTVTILTGSSMTRLFRTEQRIPVGRFERLRLHPLSFFEYLEAQPNPQLGGRLREMIQHPKALNDISPILHQAFLEQVDNWLESGGLPAAVAAFIKEGDYHTVCDTILASQEEDFVRKTSLSDKALFLQGLRGVANNLGSSSKYTHVHEQYEAARKLTGQLEDWHLVHQVEQKGIASTSRFFPKRYLYDLGIAQRVRNMPFPRLSLLDTADPALRTQLGGLFENAVLLNMMSFANGYPSISSWKKKSSLDVEVDFIWRVGNSLISIECKAALKVTPRSFASLRQYAKESGQIFGILVSAAPYSEVREGKLCLINIPIYAAVPDLIFSLVNR